MQIEDIYAKKHGVITTPLKMYKVDEQVDLELDL